MLGLVDWCHKHRITQCIATHVGVGCGVVLLRCTSDSVENTKAKVCMPRLDACDDMCVACGDAYASGVGLQGGTQHQQNKHRHRHQRPPHQQCRPASGA